MSEKVIYIIVMIKSIFIYLILLSMALSDTYKEPDYNLIKKDGKIEIRQYSEYVIAKTSLDQGDMEENNNMFRTLAGYIFGGNTDNQSIPMTAPVITQNNGSDYDMIFFMLDVDNPDQLPEPNNKNVVLENMKLGKAVTITFGMWATESRVEYYKELLDEYILENNLKIDSDLMVAQYNSPWAIPPFRKNELIYKIK
mgnify:CR=1 FL=1